MYSESKDALDPLKEEIKNELPPQRDIAIVDKYFVVSENARKYVLNLFAGAIFLGDKRTVNTCIKLILYNITPYAGF